LNELNERELFRMSDYILKTIHGPIPERLRYNITDSIPYKETAQLRKGLTPLSGPVLVLSGEPVLPAISFKSRNWDQTPYGHSVMTNSIIQQMVPNAQVYGVKGNENNKLYNPNEPNSLAKDFFKTLKNQSYPLKAMIQGGYNSLQKQTQATVDLAIKNQISVISSSTSLDIVFALDIFGAIYQDYLTAKTTEGNTPKFKQHLEKTYGDLATLESVIKKLSIELNESTILQTPKTPDKKMNINPQDSGDLENTFSDSIVAEFKIFRNLIEKKIDTYIKTDSLIKEKQDAVSKTLAQYRKQVNGVWFQSIGNNGQELTEKDQSGLLGRHPSLAVLVGESNESGDKAQPWSSRSPHLTFTEQAGVHEQGTSFAAPAAAATYLLAQQKCKQLGLSTDADFILKLMKETTVNGDLRPEALMTKLNKLAKG
jgi:hypothetical protein